MLAPSERDERGLAVAQAGARDGAPALGLAFTAGGHRLITGGVAGTVTIWDVRTRAVLGQPERNQIISINSD